MCVLHVFRLESKRCPVVMVADVCMDSNVRGISVVPVSFAVFSVCKSALLLYCLNVFIDKAYANL